MKIIFLDFDGVLINSDSTKIKNRPHRAAPECMLQLNRIVAATGAKVVVSSSWRHPNAELNEMVLLLASWGFKGEVVGQLPCFYELDRGHEIQVWLNQHHKLESFVILDDDQDMAHLVPRLVRTQFEPGLTPDDADRAIRMLLATP